MRYQMHHDNPYPALLGASIVMLLIGLLVFGASGQDDPYITYAVAQGFAEHNSLANINGDAIEQGSSILHVLLLGGLTKFTAFISTDFPGLLPIALPLPVLGIMVSLLFGLLCLPLTYRLAQQMDIRQPAIPVFLLALSTAFTYWSMGGLETTLTAFLVLHCVLASQRLINQHPITSDYVWLFLLITALVLVRPEAIFVMLAFSVISLLLFLTEETVPVSKLLFIALSAMVVFSVIALFRQHYFGQLFPQPVYAKAASFNVTKILHGLLYFLASLQLSIIIYSIFLLKPLASWLKRQAVDNTALTLSVSFAAAYLAFIIASGGDWMGGGRFFVPVIPLLVVVFCHYLQKSSRFKVYCMMLFGLLALELAAFSELQSTGMPVYQIERFKQSIAEAPNWDGYSWAETSNHIHANDIALLQAMNPVVKNALSHQGRVVISGVQMGMIPYFLHKSFGDDVYFVDMRGLTTRHITQCPVFADAPKLWTGIFVDYPHYFAAQKEGTCDLPTLDIIYELQNLNAEDNAARLQALEDYGYHVVYHQLTNIRGGIFGKKELNSPYIIAVSDTIYRRLPPALRLVEKKFRNH